MVGKILVIGATGTVGRPLVADLVARGESVKAASRKPHAADAGRVEQVALDLASGAGLEAALAEVDRVYAISPAGYLDQPKLLGPVVDAAAARGIKVALQTAMGVDADDNIPFRQLELSLERSGTPYVILRPNWFSDNFDSYWGDQVAAGRLELPAGDGATSFIDSRDIAASAAAALTSSAFDHQAFDLTGPEALTYAQAAALITRETGRPVTYASGDPETFVSRMVAKGIPEDYARFLVAILGGVAQGWSSKVTDAVERLTGRRPLTLTDYLRHRPKLAA